MIHSVGMLVKFLWLIAKRPTSNTSEHHTLSFSRGPLESRGPVFCEYLTEMEEVDAKGGTILRFRTLPYSYGLCIWLHRSFVAITTSSFLTFTPSSLSDTRFLYLWHRYLEPGCRLVLEACHSTPHSRQSLPPVECIAL